MSGVEPMLRMWTLIANTFGESLRRKVIWVTLGGTLVFSIQSIVTFFQVRGLTVAELMQAKAAELAGTAVLFQNWTRASILLSIALGSLVLPWEFQQRTILTVLA